MIVLNSRRKRSFRLSVSLLQAPGSSLRRAASIRRSLLVIPLLVRKKKQLSSFLHDLAPSERFYTDSASVPGLCCRAHCEGLNCESVNMKIGQVAPLMESVPPRLYGGTERIVSYLTEELVRMGHEVTLFASGDSITSA